MEPLPGPKTALKTTKIGVGGMGGATKCAAAGPCPAAQACRTTPDVVLCYQRHALERTALHTALTGGWAPPTPWESPFHRALPHATDPWGGAQSGPKKVNKNAWGKMLKK